MQHKLIQCEQDEEDEQTAHRVNDEQAPPCGVQPAAGSHEQAGADRATDGDHLQLSRFEAPVAALILVGERRRVVFGSDPIGLTLGAEQGTRNSKR